jgi:TPR repeat protein
MAMVGVSLLKTVEVCAQTYAQARQAYDDGHFAVAADIWRPLARVGSVRAQHALGVLHDRGSGETGSKPTRAARWYRRAAAQGHRDAQTNLGRLYATGRGVTERPSKAADLWRRAARHGHAVAQYNLALAYRQGRGVAADRRRAARWLRRAAAQDLPQAQHALARMYRLGRGRPRDPGLALAWYARAAGSGHAAAKRRARTLREQGVRPAELDDAASRPVNDEAGARAGRYTVWLGSAPTRDAARRRWRALERDLPQVMERIRPRLRTVSIKADDRVTRLMTRTFPRREAASDVCAELRARDRDAFCQVLALRQ